MTKTGQLDSIRQAALGALQVVEARDRELNRVLTGECGVELAAYFAAIRDARQRFELLERQLLEEFRQREAAMSASPRPPETGTPG